jgi:hypothetical protein
MVTPAQLSLAAGAGQLTTAPQTPGLLFVEMFRGHEVNTGASLSVTVTVKLQVDVFPPASVAVYTMFVVPIGNVDPPGKPAVCTKETPAQLSVTVGATHDTTAEQLPGVLLTEIFTGHDVKIGG